MAKKTKTIKLTRAGARQRADHWANTIIDQSERDATVPDVLILLADELLQGCSDPSHIEDIATTIRETAFEKTVRVDEAREQYVAELREKWAFVLKGGRSDG